MIYNFFPLAQKPLKEVEKIGASSKGIKMNIVWQEYAGDFAKHSEVDINVLNMNMYQCTTHEWVCLREFWVW
jgi:hypothetical protein